jgi:hypothetical protein
MPQEQSIPTSALVRPLVNLTVAVAVAFIVSLALDWGTALSFFVQGDLAGCAAEASMTLQCAFQMYKYVLLAAVPAFIFIANGASARKAEPSKAWYWRHIHQSVLLYGAFFITAPLLTATGGSVRFEPGFLQMLEAACVIGILVNAAITFGFRRVSSS